MVLNHILAHALETTSLPDEIWPGLEAFIREAPDCRVIDSRQGERVVWEIPGFLHIRRFEADLTPSELGCRFHIKQQILGPLGGLYFLFCRRQWQKVMTSAARRLAGGLGHC